MYKLVIKSAKKGKIVTIEQYLLYYSDECKLLADLQNTYYRIVGLETTRYQALSKLQSDKKDDLPEADINDIIELYC
jgi:hypothetical protein